MIDLKKNNKYQILTDLGFKDFYGIKKVKSKIYFKLILSNNDIIKATPNHQLYNKNKQSIKISKLKVGQYLTQQVFITNIERYQLEDNYEQFYDINDVKNQNNSFLISNQISSHNCGGDCIMLSTPRGVGNTFHKQWKKAVQGQNKFNPIQLGWQVHPDRDQAWAKKQRKSSGQKKFAREYDCDFSMSGQNFIDQRIIKQLRSRYQIEPIDKLDNDRLWIFKYPQADKDYILTADVGRGDGGDYSVFHLIDIKQNQQVAEYKGHIKTKQFGELIVRIATMYNKAFVIIENATVGHATVETVLNLKYKNIYYHKKDYKYFDQQLQPKHAKKVDKQKDIAGFTTSSKTRPLILEKLDMVMQQMQFIIHSKRTYNQFDTFVWINGKAQAMAGYNDDLIMSLAIGIWVRNTSYVVSKQSRKYIKSRMNSINSGLHQKRQKEQKINTGFFNARNNYTRGRETFQVGNEDVDLLKFLFPKKYR